MSSVAASLYFGSRGLFAVDALAGVVLFSVGAAGFGIGVLWLLGLLLEGIQYGDRSSWRAATAAMVVAFCLLLPAVGASEAALGGKALKRLVPMLALAVGFTFVSCITLVARRRPIDKNEALLGALVASATLSVGWLWTFGYASETIHRIAIGAGYVLSIGLAAITYRARGGLRAGIAMPVVLLLPCLAPGVVAVARAGAAVETPLAGVWPEGRPRHVILLTIDTLRADALDAGLGLTPRWNELAGESVVFERAFSPAAWTKPAVASIMTGATPSVHGALSLNSKIPEEFDTLAELMSRAGYRTAAFQGNPLLQRPFRFNQGFSIYSSPSGALGHSIGAKIAARICDEQKSNQTTMLTEQAMAWLRSEEESPAFLWLHYFDPHLPYAPPREFLPVDLEDDGGKTLFANVDAVRHGNKLSAGDRGRIRSLYEAEVRFVDQQVGRLLDDLRARGIYDDALIVFTSDHGEEFWEHDGFEHGHSFYDEVVRVPLMIKLPGNGSALRAEAPVSTRSVMPTILDIVGIDVSDGGMLAPSLADRCRGESAPDSPIVSHGALYFEDGIAIVFDGLKYIQRAASGSERLYDMERDSAEQVSIAATHPDAIETARALRAQYHTESAALRERMGLEGIDRALLPPEVERALDALGYSG